MRRKLVAVIAALVIALSVAVVGPTPGPAQAASVRSGGTVTTLLQDIVFADVDPAYGQETLLQADFMEAIFGELFTFSPGGKVGFGFASGYRFSDDNKIFTFTLKKGIKFSDGTPFNAQAVAFNITRDLSVACLCQPDFQYVKKVVASGPYTVEVQMSHPDAVILQAFVNNSPDWIASPTAIKKMGKIAFGEHPVGAGPFEVVSIVPNSKVVLKKNPGYYVKGEPELDGLTFETQTEDQSSYAALQSGSAQIVAGVTTPSVITEAESNYDVKLLANPLMMNLELNSFKPPLNNLLAREAVAYAINPAEIKAINSPGLGQLVQGPQGPGGTYFEPVVKGYRAYDVAKAKQLVKQIGGLSFTLTSTNTPSSIVELTSLQTQLANAGIKVKLQPEELPLEIKQLGEGSWQAVTSGVGGIDPDVGGLDLYNHFGSTGFYTCCKDKTLDQLMLESYYVPNGPTRQDLFDRIYTRIDDQAYIVPLYAAPENVIAAKNIGGLTLTPNAEGSVAVTIPWATLHYTN